MSTTETNQYAGEGKLLKNYGWVQNTSNLSTVRDTVDLLPDESINHNEMMRRIFAYRSRIGDIKKKWTWDARCRIKAICATGMVEIDRDCQGYRITELGKELRRSQKSDVKQRRSRALSDQEV